MHTAEEAVVEAVTLVKEVHTATDLGTWQCYQCHKCAVH